MKLYIAMQDGVLIYSREESTWHLHTVLEQKPVYCMAVDPHWPERVYCGTFGEGLWISDDGGITWRQAEQWIGTREVTAVAVSQAEKNGQLGSVWVGTEPSAVYYSNHGGELWEARPTLLDVPSSATWMFPPRPYTHHVRWIQPDIHVPERLFVGIEMGGVIQSNDNGVSWEDRKPGSQLDAHTLRMHPLEPGRIYEASGGDDPDFHHSGPLGEFVTLKGGGYAESRDGGATWQTIEKGLEKHHYLWSIAIDPGDPGTMVASAAPGPQHAHEQVMAETYVYRRHGESAWQLSTQGLPEAHGTLISEIATNEQETGVFYLANNHGVYRSGDAGVSWEPLKLEWPTKYRWQQIQGFVVIP